MKDKIKKIKNELTSTATSSPCKYIIGFLIVFSVVSFASYAVITNLETTVKSKNVNYTEFTVKNKYNDHSHYIIIGSDNNTYEIMSIQDFNQIDIGSHYHFIVQYPQEKGGNIHIIQVYNETGGRQI